MSDEPQALTFYPSRDALLGALQSSAPNVALRSISTEMRTAELREHLRSLYSHRHSRGLSGGTTDTQAHALLSTARDSMCAWLLHEGPAGFAVLREDVLTQAVDCRADSQVGRMVLMSALSVLAGSVKVRVPLFRNSARATSVPSKLPFFTRAAARAAQNTHATSAEWHEFLHSAFYTEALCRTGAGGFMRILFDALLGCSGAPGPNESAVADIVARFFDPSALDCACYMTVVPTSKERDITLLSEAMSAGATHVASAILHALLGSDRRSIPSLGDIAEVRAADIWFTDVESNYLYATLLAAPYWRTARAISRGALVPNDDRQLLNRFMRIAALPSVECRVTRLGDVTGPSVLAGWVENVICETGISDALCGSTMRCAQVMLAKMSHDSLRRVLCPPSREPLVMRALCAGILPLVQVLLDYMNHAELMVSSAAGAHIGELLFHRILAYSRVKNKSATRICAAIWKGLIRRCPSLAMANDHTLYTSAMLPREQLCIEGLGAELIDSAQWAALLFL